MPDAGKIEQYPYHRKFVRAKVRLRVQVRADQSYQTWTHNISEGGTCFEIPERVQVEREVTVWVYLHSGQEVPPVMVVGRVVWSDRGKKGFRHGAQFLTFTGDGKERLARHLSSL
jgi:hypothetical protein